jgi:curved DNA-binding protein CbpA
MPHTNPFAILGIPQSADDAAIRQAYLRLVRRYSPDQEPERFKAIAAAYGKIKDHDARMTLQLLTWLAPDRRTLMQLCFQPKHQQPAVQPNTLQEALTTTLQSWYQDTLTHNHE